MWDMFQGYAPPLQKQILMRMMWGTIFKVRSVPRMALCLQSFLFSPKFVFGFQYNPICRDFRSESRYWNKHNTSLHLWPPSSSSSLWMRGNNGGEQGRGRKIAALFRCLLKVHKLKDSTFNSGNKSVRKPTCKMLHTRLLQMEIILFITLGEKKNHNYKEGSWVYITLGYQFISP